MPGRHELKTALRQLSELQSISRTDPVRFTAETQELSKQAEDTRLRFMRAREGRKSLVTYFTALCFLGGLAGFGWRFIMAGDLLQAAPFLLFFLFPWPFFWWANAPLAAYRRAYKSEFLPKMAEALGRFHYSAHGGVGEKMLRASGVLPDFDRYDGEDCFLGMYKGVKVILSEARLYKGSERAFQGLVALLELPQKIADGRAIVTADQSMAQAWATTRWRTLTQVAPVSTRPEADRFLIFAENADEGPLLAGDKLIKELAEASTAFDRAPVTASFFKGNYVFLVIPCKTDLFEPSDIEEPIPSARHAETLRLEIGKLLEIIDLFEIYRARLPQIGDL